MHSRKGLTTVELLTAIAVVLILAAIVVYGLSATGNNARTRQTESILENCKSLLKELDVATRLTQNPEYFWHQGGQVTPSANTSFWKDHDPANGLQGTVAPDESMELIVGGLRDGRIVVDNRYYDGIFNMRIAMLLMRAIPANKTAIQNFPNDQLLTFPALSDSGPMAAALPGVPVPLDGWGNPIIFVPAAGLTVTTSSGTLAIRSADNRPFFASAGPDGRFNGRDPANNNKYSADDNIYSFEK